MAAFGVWCKAFVIVCLAANHFAQCKVVTTDKEWNDCCPSKFCPNLQSLVGESARDDTRYAKICQLGWRGDTPYFATLYDKTNRIPVFSMFQIEHDGDAIQPQGWRYEGDLIDLSEVKTGHIYDAEDIHYKTDQRFRDIYDKIRVSQAVYRDYRSHRPYEQGHLNPLGTYSTLNGKISTLTYTNAVPQRIDFNNGTWSNIEEAIRKYTGQLCPKTNQVVVGVLPGKHLLNGRVNIPSHFWSYVHCNEQVAFFLAPNRADSRIQRGNLITQFFLESNNLNSVIEKLHNFDSITKFRRQMRHIAALVPQSEMFSEALSCNSQRRGVWKCSGVE